MSYIYLQTAYYKSHLQCVFQILWNSWRHSGKKMGQTPKHTTTSRWSKPNHISEARTRWCETCSCNCFRLHLRICDFPVGLPSPAPKKKSTPTSVLIKILQHLWQSVCLGGQANVKVAIATGKLENMSQRAWMKWMPNIPKLIYNTICSQICSWDQSVTSTRTSTAT